VSSADLAAGFTVAPLHPKMQPTPELNTSRSARFTPLVFHPAIRRIVTLLDRLFNTQDDSGWT